MTIDDARREMISGKPYTDKFAMALVVAIDILRKYQKIQEIMAKRPKDMIISNPTLRAISEVLEDGNDSR